METRTYLLSIHPLFSLCSQFQCVSLLLHLELHYVSIEPLLIIFAHFFHDIWTFKRVDESYQFLIPNIKS